MQKEFIYSDQWLDQLFENKNKLYGAYLLRKRNADNTLIAFMWAVTIYVGIGLSIFIGYKAYTFFSDAVAITIPRTEVKIVDYNPTQPPVNKEIQKQSASSPSFNKNVIPTITSDSILNDDDKDKGNIVIPANGSTPGNPNDTSDIGGGAVTYVAPIEKPKPIYGATQMPEFPGGEEAMLDWLRKEINYPDEMSRQQKQGVVYVQFVVATDGKVTDLTVLSEVKDAKPLTEEALRAIKNMPDWIPGEQNGQKVAVYYTLPVNFRLQ
jgi:periplasmic protein TonB